MPMKFSINKGAVVDNRNFVNWDGVFESANANEQVENFRRQAMLYGISTGAVNMFLTTCYHLCELGREGELKARLNEQLRVYKGILVGQEP